MKKLILFLLSAVFCFTGCSASHNEEAYQIRNKDIAFYSMDYNCYENGLIYIWDNQAYFLDYTTMQGVPLCNKPNCTHTDGTCIAFACCNNSVLPFVYHDYVYWFESDFEIVDAADGKSQIPNIQTTCKRAALDTGEIEDFAEIDGVFMNSATCACIVADTLYIIGSYELMQDADGGWWGASDSGNQYLYAVQLETAEVENYGLVNDSPYAENAWCYGSVIFPSVEIDGVYDRKIYMHYQYLEDEQDIIDLINNEDTTSYEVISAFPWNYENKSFDLETKKMTNSDISYAQVIQEGMYVYEDLISHQINIMDENKTSIVASNMAVDGVDDFAVVNQKVWKGSNNACFDIASETCYTFTEKYTDVGASVMAYVDGQYIVEYYDESGTLCFDKVNESDLIQGD